MLRCDIRAEANRKLIESVKYAVSAPKQNSRAFKALKIGSIFLFSACEASLRQRLAADVLQANRRRMPWHRVGSSIWRNGGWYWWQLVLREERRIGKLLRGNASAQRNATG